MNESPVRLTFFRLVFTLICWGMILVGMPALWAMSSKPKVVSMKHVQSLKGIEEYQLESNGLRVLLREDHSSPVAAVMVSYQVGSRNEEKGFTGAAHILEHMMFKGTDEYRKSLGTSVAQILEGVGAVLNANTGHDATHYYEMLPNDNIELALDIEASRMSKALLDEKDFQAEKQVVLNELERYFDSPTIDLTTKIWQTAYQKHTYHHPIIGWREEVQDMPVQAIRDLYKNYYHPGNATLTIVGDFDPEKTRALIQEKFGKIKAVKEQKNAFIEEEPIQTEAREIKIERGTGSNYIVISHKMPGALEADALHLDLLGFILSRGKLSRLSQKMVQTGLVVKVDSGSSGTRDPGLFSTHVTLTDKLSHEDAQAMVLGAYQEVAEKGVSAEELSRAISQLESEMAFARDGAFSMASELSHAISFGDWKHFVEYLDHARQVSPDELQKAAQRYFREDQMTVGKLVIGAERKKEEAAGESGEFSHSMPNEGPPPVGQVLPERIQKLMQSRSDAVKDHYEKHAEVLLEDNLKLILYPTGSENIVSLAGSFDFAGSAYHVNPVVPWFTALMLDKGTQKHSKLEIAKVLENRGAQLTFNIDYEHLRFNIRCLKRDLSTVLDLFFEQIRLPLFDSEELQKAKERQRVGIEQAMASTSSVGLTLFLGSLYPEDHPNHHLPFEKQLELLDQVTIEDLKTFHQNHYGRQNLIISVAGDFDGDAVGKQIISGVSDWPVHALQADYVDTETFIAPTDSQEAQVSGMMNFDVFLGHPVPLNRLDPDYVSASIATQILGGDFSARLSSIIRDQYGYTYGIRSGLMGVSETLDGIWTIHLIVNPPLLEKAIKATVDELERFAAEGINSFELQNSKRTVTGKFKVGLATVDALAANLLKTEEQGLGIGYLDRYPVEVNALELDQVNGIIRRYYKPELLFTVTAGDHIS